MGSVSDSSASGTKKALKQDLLVPDALTMSDKSDFYELQQQPLPQPRDGYPYTGDHNPTNVPSKHDRDGVHTGTSADAQDMQRMGRKQELRRNFHSVSILGLAAVTMATWIAMLMANIFSLINGGLAGTVWVYFASWICTLTLVASLAEMASMAPTSGGQYRRSLERPFWNVGV